MKKNVFSISILLILISSCSLLLGPDANIIADWFNLPKDGTEYVMRWHDNYEGSTDSGAYSMEVIEVEDRDTRAFVRYRDDYGDDYYIVMDKDEETIAFSYDEYFDKDDDFIILQTPVEVGEDWYTGVYKAEIMEIDKEYSCDAGDFNDIVEVYLRYVDGDYKHEITLYWSRKEGFIVYWYEKYSWDGEAYYTYTEELDEINE